jgi:glutathione peroxidase
MTPIESIAVETIDGAPSNLGHFTGTVRLVVNVASRCGLTPQYKALEATYRKFKDRGFAVLGFPANEFGGQEPGTNSEIKKFCAEEYDVTFPMFAKLVVKGDGQHALYKALTEEQPNAQYLPDTDFRGELMKYGIKPGSAAEILWNFEKFLLDRSGNVVARFGPDVPPDAEMVTSAIEKALA